MFGEKPDRIVNEINYSNYTSYPTKNQIKLSHLRGGVNLSHALLSHTYMHSCTHSQTRCFFTWCVDYDGYFNLACLKACLGFVEIWCHGALKLLCPRLIYIRSAWYYHNVLPTLLLKICGICSFSFRVWFLLQWENCVISFLQFFFVLCPLIVGRRIGK